MTRPQSINQSKVQFIELTKTELERVDGGQVGHDVGIGVVFTISLGIIGAIFDKGTLRGLRR